MINDGQFGFAGTDRFEITGYLGSGGMGTVYRALDRETSSTVALKLLETPQVESILRFRREFRALHDLQHENLIGLGELGETDGDLFFTMEYVEGVDFLEHVASEARWRTVGRIQNSTRNLRDAAQAAAQNTDSARRVTAVQFDEVKLRDAMAQLMSGLAALHDAGMVHRDIKPSNVMIAKNGRLVVLDFGLMLEIDGEDRLSEENVLGTAAYMAPEQIQPKGSGPPADCYAVGIMLYEALSGRLPFDGPLLQVITRKQTLPPPPPSSIAPGVPSDLDELCLELLAIDPRARPTARNLAARLTSSQARRSASQPLPASSEAAPQEAVFCGRDKELAHLISNFSRRGAARITVLRSDSGMGKTTLLRRFADSCAEIPDALVLSARCFERERVSYKGVDSIVEALAHHLRDQPSDELDRILPEDVELLVNVFPSLGLVTRLQQVALANVRRLGAHELQRRAFSALRELLTRVARNRSTLIIIDDMQWANADGWTLLTDLMHPPDAPPLLLLLAMRRTNTPGGSGVLAQAEVIELDLLDSATSRDLATRLLEQRGADVTAADAIASEAEGHPLFIHQLAQHVAEGGAIATLEEALKARFERLTVEARDLLGLVAVAARPLSQAAIATAAELSFVAFNRVATELRSAGFINTSGPKASATIDVSHNRIREAIFAGLGEWDLDAYHRRLFSCLEQTGLAERFPTVALHHLLAAHDKERAAQYAETAAERAHTALAFERAAELYQLAIELAAPDQRSPRLTLACADALAHAGRSSEAANLYLASAEFAHVTDRIDQLRNAAQQLLYGGYVADGVHVLSVVLAELDEALPRTPKRALLYLIGQRIRLRLRGLHWTERDASEIAQRDRVRLEVYHAVAAGLGLVDNIRSAAYQCRYLRLALKLGDRDHLIQSLSLETVFAAGQGAGGRARKLREKARQLGENYEVEARSRAYIWFAIGAVHYFVDNDWTSTWQSMDAVETLLRSSGDAGWELDTAHMYKCFALLNQGTLRELSRRVSLYLRAADRRGDLYASVSLRNRLVMPILATNDVEAARSDLESSAACWLPWNEAFHVQHFFALHSNCEIDIYAGDPDRAQQRIDEQIATFRRTLMLRVPIVRSEMNHLQARIALARAIRSEGSERAAHLRHARKLARTLAGEHMPGPRSWANVVRAGASHLAGDDDSARGALHAAVTAFSARTSLYAPAAKHALGGLIGGSEGDELKAQAQQWAEENRIASPEGMFELLAPGWHGAR